MGAAGGQLLARFRDPLGGAGLVLAALPLSRIAPTPFQRDLSEAHAKRLSEAIEEVGVFLDPVIGVPAPEGAETAFWSPNGLHRLSALEGLGARSVTALLSPSGCSAARTRRVRASPVRRCGRARRPANGFPTPGTAEVLARRRGRGQRLLAIISASLMYPKQLEGLRASTAPTCATSWCADVLGGAE